MVRIGARRYKRRNKYFPDAESHDQIIHISPLRSGCTLPSVLGYV